MLTYQDLIKVGDNEAKRAKFCRSAISEFQATRQYKEAQDGEAYYNKHNRTIEDYEKTLRTLSGREIKDDVSANHKIKTLFFRRLVTQQTMYVLGNGVQLSDPENKAKLGADFDFKLVQAVKRGMAAGCAFGFWNYDHMEVFGYADTDTKPGFCPLYDENTSELMAGIRFWFRQTGKKYVFRATLYEVDGYTDYIQINSEEPYPLNEKRAYKNISQRIGETTVNTWGENYGMLPIVPLYVNDSHESELIGIREAIDCYDLIKSGFCNEIDDTSGIYWVLEGTGGMDDVDLAEFVKRIRNVRAAMLEDGASAKPTTVDIPVEARKTILNLIRSDIYEDFQALDVKSLSAAEKTAQEIQAAYQPMDDKCDDFEYFVIDFLQKIFAIAGIDDNPVFTRSKIINQKEQTETVMLAAQYLPKEMVIRKLPWLTPEEREEAIARMDEADFNQFNADDEGDDE